MWLVFQKEVRELLRDKKTLFFMVALPILVFPLIAGVALMVGQKVVKDAQVETRTYSIVGAENSAEFVKKLGTLEQFELVALPSEVKTQEQIIEHVKADKVDFVVTLPDNFTNNILMNGQIELTLYRNQANQAGLNVVERELKALVNQFSDEYQNTAFEQLTLNEIQQKALIEPISIKQVNVADERETSGAIIGPFVAYFIFMLCLQGAMLPASDLGAGEKERGTLETLLITPIERNKLVLGKFLTIAFAGIVSALFTVLSMAIWLTLGSQQMGSQVMIDVMAAVGPLDFFLVFFMLTPVVAIFAALLLTLSIYARSFKEAQGYMTPLVIVTIIPAMFAILPGVELKGVWAWVPLTNVALAIRELIKGTMDYVQLLSIFSSTAIIAAGLLAFCIYWFKQEKVLFR